ncbi:odorant receptor 46a-like [Sipha flava]|uniref:Odorant receptor n=1 Tax=Sipha flava TaxID=143950 RepID=A0A8B8GCA7_9HEMI|nr:odorant receptor 46a-like [Sipha flava]
MFGDRMPRNVVARANVDEDDDGGGRTAMDVELFRVIGLMRLVRPARGRTDRWYRAAVAGLVRLAFVLQGTQVVGLYFALNDFQRFANMAVLLISGLMSLYKGHVLAANAARVWDTLRVTRFAYVTCSGRDAGRLRRTGDALRPLLRAFYVFSYLTLAMWISMPCFMHDRVPMAAPDGTVAEYRMTVNNLWIPVPPAVYNAPAVWAPVYAVEAFMVSANVFVWVLFDCYLITMCFVLNAQLRTMSAAYEKLGVHGPAGVRAEKNEMKLNYYDDLIEHIKDSQRIMKKLDDFFDIVRPVVLVQIVNGSFSVVTLMFILSLLYIMGWSVVSPPFLKFSAGFISLTMQLYIYCYAFNYIETEKCSMNFGLYCSNWTEMDLKFKKTVLLAMNLNSAHNRQMKVSPTSIINLAMFARVMNMSYSILPVLLNVSTGK